ncbi:MAG: hypothetical protein ACXVBE_02280 [Bdellovibrionota bacterium]
MKTLFAALICLLPLAASAAETQTLVCQGKELAIGNTGKRGEIVITATKLTDIKYDRRVDFTVQWSGSDSMLTGPGIVCGQELPAGEECATEVSHPGNLSFQINSVCGKATYIGSVPTHKFSTFVVLGYARANGRVNCRANGAPMSIELSHCESK